MKLAIMQPYLFPYIGYFQLINAVDTFVFYDDVNYIKQGWINRNRILLNNKDHILTLQLIGSSSFKQINEIGIGNSNSKMIKTIAQAYHKTPFYPDVYPLVENILNYSEKNLAKFIQNSLKMISEYLEIKTKFIISSELEKKQNLKGEEKVIHICEILKAKKYINSIGGKELYSKDHFLKENIELLFLQSESISYNQLNDVFFPNLSIIDVLMHNGKDGTKQLLNNYTLI
jgi:hypothetical protein